MTLTIDIYSDVVCPWCYLGERRLKRALSIASEIDTAIGWKPFRLDPTIPRQGIDRAKYISDKFGSAEAIEPAHQRLAELGRVENIDYRFDAITRSPDTTDAHRLSRWAAAEGKQEAMVDRLFAAYFTEGKDVGDATVLTTLAGEAGLDTDAVAARLATDEDRDTVAEEIERAYRIGITGVPTFVLAGKYAVVGAQEALTIVEALRQVAAKVAAPAAAG